MKGLSLGVLTSLALIAGCKSESGAQVKETPGVSGGAAPSRDAAVRQDVRLPAGTRIVGLHHFGLTVPDIDQAIELFATLGCKAGGNAGGRGGPWFGDDAEKALNLDKGVGAGIKFFQFVDCGSVHLELFQYDAQQQNRTWPANSDLGGSHIAFAVDDLDEVTRSLRDAKAQGRLPGIEIMTGPGDAPPGPVARWVYVTAQWTAEQRAANARTKGLQLELVQLRR